MKLLLLACCLPLLGLPAFSQKGLDTSKASNRYQDLQDSLALLYPTLPAVASVVLKRNQLEVIVFNALLSGKKFRDTDGSLHLSSYRQSYLYSTLQVNLGISRNDRLNVGVGIQTTMARIDDDENASPFNVFSSRTTAGSWSARAVSSLTPRIRWRPFATNYRFTVQSSVSLPLGLSAADQQLLGAPQVAWLNQFIYNQPLSNRLFLLSQLSVQHVFKRRQVPGALLTPLSLYLSYYLPRRTVVFTLLNAVPVWAKTQNRHTIQAGAGAQYQLSRQLLVNGYYAHDVWGKNYPHLATYSLGLRLVSH